MALSDAAQTIELVHAVCPADGHGAAPVQVVALSVLGKEEGGKLRFHVNGPAPPGPLFIGADLLRTLLVVAVDEEQGRRQLVQLPLQRIVGRIQVVVDARISQDDYDVLLSLVP